MKKLTLIILVAMVPFLTMAQKSKRKTNSNPPELMVIKGVQLIHDYSSYDAADISEKDQHWALAKQIAFDQVRVILQDQPEPVSIEDAVDEAISRGFEFHSSNVVVVGNSLVHYYYMKK